MDEGIKSYLEKPWRLIKLMPDKKTKEAFKEVEKKVLEEIREEEKKRDGREADRMDAGA